MDKAGVVSRRSLLSGAATLGLHRFLPARSARAADQCACLAQTPADCEPTLSSPLVAGPADAPRATVTIGAPNAAASIRSWDAVLIGDPAIRYLGATPVAAGNTPIRKYYLRPLEQTMIWAFDVAFPDGCSVFEIATFGSGNGWLRVIADGMLAHAERSVQGPPADGNAYLVRVDLGAYRAREIRIEMTYGFWFRGLVVPKGTAVAPVERPTGPRVVVVGDSFAEGTGAPTLEGMVPHLASFMGWIDVGAAAMGGTGYLNPGPAELNRSPYIDRIEHDVIARLP